MGESRFCHHKVYNAKVIGNILLQITSRFILCSAKNASESTKYKTGSN
jgi:hypothetical protein